MGVSFCRFFGAGRPWAGRHKCKRSRNQQDRNDTRNPKFHDDLPCFKNRDFGSPAVMAAWAVFGRKRSPCLADPSDPTRGPTARDEFTTPAENLLRSFAALGRNFDFLAPLCYFEFYRGFHARIRGANFPADSRPRGIGGCP